MKKSIVFPLFFFCIVLSAQESLHSAADDISTSLGSIYYSIGQITYTTDRETNGSVSRGVQQPHEITVLVGAEEKNIELEMSVYPNPTTDFLTLRVKEYDVKNLTAVLYDIKGQLIRQIDLSGQQAQIDLTDLTKSTYLLQVKKGGNVVKIFKVIRN